MDALFQFFPAHYGIHRVAATLHFSEYRLRERDRSCGVLTPAECHQGHQRIDVHTPLLACLSLTQSDPYYGISNKFHVRGYSPSFFSALYLEGSKIGEVFPGGS
jgi:hypothetical protein